MPAAAVIPAPEAYINIAAVKKLVVGFRGGPRGLPIGMYPLACPSFRGPCLSLTGWVGCSGLLL